MMRQTFSRSRVTIRTEAAWSDEDGSSGREGEFSQALEQLRQQGLDLMRRDLVANGNLIDAEAVCCLLGGISRADLEARVERRELLALPSVELGALGWVEGFPRIQFTESGILPGFAEVLAVLPDEDPWVHFNYLVNPDARLDGCRPIDLLQHGEIPAVVAAARRAGEIEADD